MVKVQKRIAFKRKDQAYFKHMVTVPESAFKALKWKEGQQLEHSIAGQNQLVFTPIEAKSKASVETKSKSKKRR